MRPLLTRRTRALAVLAVAATVINAPAQSGSAAEAALRRDLARTQDQLSRAIDIAKQYKADRAQLRDSLEASIKESSAQQRQIDDLQRQIARQESAQARLANEDEDRASREGALQKELKETQRLLAEQDRELKSLRRRLSAGVVSAEDAKRANEALVKASTLAAEGDVKGAIRAYRSGIDAWPEHLGLRMGLAGCHYQEGDMEEARSSAEAILEMNPDHAEALSLVGLIAWQDGDLRTADRTLRNVTELQPQVARYHVYRGIVLYERDRLSDAREELETALRLDPNSGEAAFNLAVVLAAGDSPDLSAARLHYQSAMRLGGARDPNLEQRLFSAP